MSKKPMTPEEELAERFDSTIAKVGKHQRKAKQDAAEESKFVPLRKLARQRLSNYYKAAEDLANSGMAGYQEWITSFMEIVKTNRELGKAIKAYYPILKKHKLITFLPSLFATYITTPLGSLLWTDSCKDQKGLSIPDINYQIEMDKSGQNLTVTPTIYGVKLEEYFNENSKAFDEIGYTYEDAKEFAHVFEKNLIAGFDLWLELKGYKHKGSMVDPIPPNVEPFSPEVFQKLNATPGDTLDEFLSGRYKYHLDDHLDIHVTPKIR